MSQYDKMLFVGLIPFYLAAFGSYHLMIFRVNQQLPPDRKIPHSLYFGGWSRLAREYKGFYPRGFLYEFTLTCAVTCLIIAVGLTSLRIWEYKTGR